MKPSNNILNSGLNFSMEFGENWLLDINDRLLNKYPELAESELDAYNILWKKVNGIAHDYVYKNFAKFKNEMMAFSEFKKFIKVKYEWIDENNLRRLHNQSRYYAGTKYINIFISEIQSNLGYITHPSLNEKYVICELNKN